MSLENVKDWSSVVLPLFGCTKLVYFQLPLQLHHGQLRTHQGL